MTTLRRFERFEELFLKWGMVVVAILAVAWLVLTLAPRVMGARDADRGVPSSSAFTYIGH